MPNTFAAVVHSIQEFDRLYRMYERGNKSCFAILSKEKARDGYMCAPAVIRRENSENHKCAACGASLWTALNPDAWSRQKTWAKVGDYGFVYRPLVMEHILKAKSETLKEKLAEIAKNPETMYPARGANRAYPLSSYIKRKYKGRVYGLIVDELHQYNNKSGQGDAMAELYDTAKKVVTKM